MIRPLIARLCLAFTLALGLSLSAQAQSGQVYLQIEAHPTLNRAQDAAQGYAARLAGITGYRVPGGWYAITMGPYASRDIALAELQRLRQVAAVPADSFVVESAPSGPALLPRRAAPTAPPSVAATPAPAPLPHPHQSLSTKHPGRRAPLRAH